MLADCHGTSPTAYYGQAVLLRTTSHHDSGQGGWLMGWPGPWLLQGVKLTLLCAAMSVICLGSGDELRDELRDWPRG